MNGNINKLIPCKLETTMIVTGSYGTIKYPNTIQIHIASLEKFAYSLNKDDCDTDEETCIITMMAWSIAHELFHVEHVCDMLEYAKNQEYMDYIENEVNMASLEWLYYNQKEIYENTGLMIDCQWIIELNNTENHYKNIGIKEAYMQIMRNILIRNSDAFNEITVFVCENKFNYIRISINGIPVEIKKNGIYLKENINSLINLINYNVLIYSSYFLEFESTFNEEESFGIVDFTLSKTTITPVVLNDK